jgi:hypothetical protein
MDSSGETIVFNDGEFDYETVEVFCPNGEGCDIAAEVNITATSSPFSNDGAITINTSSGLSPFQYSIDGGQTYEETNSFNDLAQGSYNVSVIGATGDCSFEETVFIDACSLVSVEIVATNASSVVSTNGSIEINPTSGVGPYLYSIDGGQNFVSNNVFLNLPVGTYNVIVQDEANICLYEEGVPIEVELGLVEELTSHGIMIYPNPTKNDFIIEIESFSALIEPINIEVYDNLGRTIRTGSITKNGNGKTQVSLMGSVPGTYFVKCFNSGFEKHFKVVKL